MTADDVFGFVRRGVHAWIVSTAADIESSNAFLDGETDLALSGRTFDAWVLPNVASIGPDDIPNDSHPFLEDSDRRTYWRGLLMVIRTTLDAIESDPVLSERFVDGRHVVVVTRDTVAVSPIPDDASSLPGRI